MKFFTKVKFVIAAFIVILIIVFFMAFNSFGIDSDTIYSLQGEMNASVYNSARGYGTTGNTVQGLFASITEEEVEVPAVSDSVEGDSATSDGSNTWTGETVDTTPGSTDTTPISGGSSVVNTEVPSPLYKQSDSRWKDIPYGDSGNCNMKDNGCFPTSLAMIVEHLTGSTTTPDVVANWIKSNVPNYFPGGTSWSVIPAVCNNYGLTCSSAEPLTKAAIQECLDAGGCIMFRVDRGWFTGGGHGMCILGYAGDREHVYVNNPSNSGNSTGCPAGNGSSYDDSYAFSIDELLAGKGVTSGTMWRIYK